MRPSTALEALSVVFYLSLLCLILLFHLVELGDHEVVEGVCVPCSHERGENPPPDAHETTKVSEDVQEAVTRAHVFNAISVHLDGYSYVLLIVIKWVNMSFNQVEDVIFLYGSPCV